MGLQSKSKQGFTCHESFYCLKSTKQIYYNVFNMICIHIKNQIYLNNKHDPAIYTKYLTRVQ